MMNLVGNKSKWERFSKSILIEDYFMTKIQIWAIKAHPPLEFSDQKLCVCLNWATLFELSDSSEITSQLSTKI